MVQEELDLAPHLHRLGAQPLPDLGLGLLGLRHVRQHGRRDRRGVVAPVVHDHDVGYLETNCVDNVECCNWAGLKRIFT